VSVSLKVKIFESTGTRILNVAKSTLTIGSASHCDIVLDHPTVNPEHTRAWIESGRIWIQDLGSPGGTALNDIRLPSLKPMLVRDLDVLRLGESPSTLGLEAIMVRAPVVKPKVSERVSATASAREAAAPDAKVLSNVELEKRREEAETLGRELADVRLQLQMATLEKASGEDLHQEVLKLREETQRSQEQRAKWDEAVQKIEAERVALKKAAEKEMAEFRPKTLAEFKKSAGAEADHQAAIWNGQIEKLMNDCKTLRENLEAANASKANQRKSFERELQDARKEAAAAKKEAADQQSQRVILGENLRQAEGEREDLRKEVKRTTTSGGDTNKQVAALTAELRKLTDLRESERKSRENEIADIKAKTFKEVNAMLLEETQKMGAWKHEALNEMTRLMAKLSLNKVRVWATRPLSQEMIEEWEADVIQTFHRVMMNDPEAQSIPTARHKAEAMTATKSNTARLHAVQTPPDDHPERDRETDEAKEARRTRRRKARAAAKAWRSLAMTSAIVLLLAAGVWLGTTYFRQHGSRGLSSLAQTPPQLPSVSTSHPRFEPKMGKKFRGSYTENVLFLENYVSAEENMDFHKRWLNDLNKVAATEWKVDAWTLAPVLAEEQTLIQDLDNIKRSITADKEQEGVQKMKDREAKFLHDLDSVFKTRAGTEKFLKFKRSFYQRNQAYLMRSM
jgi:hypothetical protein